MNYGDIFILSQAAKEWLAQNPENPNAPEVRRSLKAALEWMNKVRA